MGFCGGCSKALLIIFNLIFWLSGAAILGVGVWMIVDKNIGSYFEVLNLDTHDQFYKYSAYILIAFGVFVFLVGFCGCCGAIRGSKCLLGFYIFFLIIILLGEAAAGILMIVYKLEVEKKLDATLKKSITEQYGESTTITDAWNVVQVQLECCGGLGPNDYNGSKYDDKQSMILPPSCCVLTNKDKAFEDPNSALPVNATLCLEMQGEYHTKGCKEGLKDWAAKHIGILIGVAIGIAALQIIGIVCACCLCCRLRKEVD